MRTTAPRGARSGDHTHRGHWRWTYQTSWTRCAGTGWSNDWQSRWSHEAGRKPLRAVPCSWQATCGAWLGSPAWPHPERVHPHAPRHTAVTLALDSGANLVDVQDMAGHVDPRTTRRYDRARGRLDREPSYALAVLLDGS